MILTVAGFKGGVGKTTTAVHLAAYLAADAPTLLVDGDPNRSATAWAQRGENDMPFRTVDERQAARYAREYEHIVIDTAARPEREDLEALADGCDLLVVPATPDALSLDALMQTLEELDELGADAYRVLLTIVPPRPSHDSDDAREALAPRGVPMFETEIPRLVAFQKASLEGVPVYGVSDPRAGVAWEAYERAGKEITG